MCVTKEATTDLNASSALSSFKLRSSSKSVSFSTSRILGPTKMPSLSLAALRPGNTVDKCWKAAPFCATPSQNSSSNQAWCEEEEEVPYSCPPEDSSWGCVCQEQKCF